jgi:hypothetical protein
MLFLESAVKAAMFPSLEEGTFRDYGYGDLQEKLLIEPFSVGYLNNTRSGNSTAVRGGLAVAVGSSLIAAPTRTIT